MPEQKTLSEICKDFGVPIEEAMQALNNTGKFVAVHPDISVYGNTLEEYKKIVKELKFKSNPEEDTKIVKKIKFNSNPNKNYLTRDFIIFTHSALKKTGFDAIIKDFFEKKTDLNTNSKVVILEACFKSIMRESQQNQTIKKNATALNELNNRNSLITLQGNIIEEDKVLGNFINNNRNRYIIVFGKTGGLSRQIAFLNNNRNNKIIYERDFVHTGRIINPNVKPVFEEINSQKILNKGRITDDIPDKCVYNAKREPIYLEEIIHKGGAEGVIYQINVRNKCAKIFNDKSCSELKTTKTAIMCQKYSQMYERNPVIMERIAWPEELLYNRKGQIIGYQMKYFKNAVPFSNYNNESFKKYIPNVTKAHQVHMAKSFTEIVLFMHDNNVILCDINRGNILFDNNQQAYIVDIDSAQIADQKYVYTSNVGRTELLSPEHIMKEGIKYSFVHKKADDVWILQNMLFLMLTPIAKPYLTVKNLTEEEAVARGEYPFQCGENHAVDLAGDRGGVWHIIISHFPKFLKEDFWNSFHHDGIYFKEANRLTVDDWFDRMLKYESALPKMIERDSESGKFIPTKPKKADESYVENTENPKAPKKDSSNKKDIYDNKRSWDNIIK